MTKHIHAAAVIFENENGEILVLHRQDDIYEGGTWGLVGGKLEAGEDPRTAVIREVQEEIGHTLDDLKLEFVRTYQWQRPELNLTFELFRLPTLTHEVAIDIDQKEHSEHRWVSPTELYGMPNLMQGLYVTLEDVYGIGR